MVENRQPIYSGDTSRVAPASCFSVLSSYASSNSNSVGSPPSAYNTSALCGNGVVDEFAGEECDGGTCCDATCKLHPSAQCGDASECCQSCRPVLAGAQCRGEASQTSGVCDGTGKCIESICGLSESTPFCGVDISDVNGTRGCTQLCSSSSSSCSALSDRTHPSTKEPLTSGLPPGGLCYFSQAEKFFRAELSLSEVLFNHTKTFSEPVEGSASALLTLPPSLVLPEFQSLPVDLRSPLSGLSSVSLRHETLGQFGTFDESKVSDTTSSRVYVYAREIAVSRPTLNSTHVTDAVRAGALALSFSPAVNAEGTELYLPHLRTAPRTLIGRPIDGTSWGDVVSSAPVSALSLAAKDGKGRNTLVDALSVNKAVDGLPLARCSTNPGSTATGTTTASCLPDRHRWAITSSPTLPCLGLCRGTMLENTNTGESSTTTELFRGLRPRSVKCVRTGSDGAEVEEDDQYCVTDWLVGKLGGDSSSDVVEAKLNTKPLAWERCEAKPATLTSGAEAGDCVEPRWAVGKWSLCGAECSADAVGGFRTRSVGCADIKAGDTRVTTSTGVTEVPWIAVDSLIPDVRIVVFMEDEIGYTTSRSGDYCIRL